MAKEGDRIPEARVWALDPEHDEWEQANTRALFATRTVVAFALPGAFTPTCSGRHLPRYEELASAFYQVGVDEVMCFAVNDPFVLQAWAQDQGLENVVLVADGNGDFARAMGMLMDKREDGLGERSRRYSMLVRDGVIERLFVEADGQGDPFAVSDADSMLETLRPGAKKPDQVVILTREGCPYCAQAKEMLEEADLDYVELPLDAHVRSTVVGALTGHATVPQVFINGKLVGGTEELEAALYGPGGRPLVRTE